MKTVFFDIGSHSLRCMTAERIGKEGVFSSKSVFPTYLAEQLEETGLLSLESMERAAAAIASYAELFPSETEMHAYATSAVRDAGNGSEFADRIREMGVSVRILKGREEAVYAYQACEASGGMLDIGGGSCQLILGERAESFPMGCVRALSCLKGKDLLHVRKSLEPVLDRVFGDLSAWRIKERWSGVGGTITSLAAGMQDLSEYVREAVNGYAIRRELLPGMLEKLDRMGEKGRERHPVFSPRKDTILPGGVILQYLMDRLDMDAIIASDMDGLEGYAISVLFPEGKPERIRFLTDF